MNFLKVKQDAFANMKAAIASNNPLAAQKFQSYLTDAQWCDCLLDACKRGFYVIVSNLVYDKDVRPFAGVMQQALTLAGENFEIANTLQIAIEKSPNVPFTKM